MAHIVTNTSHYSLPTPPPTRGNAEQRGATTSNNEQEGPIGGNCEIKITNVRFGGERIGPNEGWEIREGNHKC